MPEAGIRSTYSQAPIRISLHDDHGELGVGSAFRYQAGNGNFLVTNWHNVSGRNAFTGEYLAAHRSPLILEAYIARWLDNHVPRNFGLLPVRINLYSTDRQTPRWLEHPLLGSSCDVAAIPFPDLPEMPDFMHAPANRISSCRIPVKPGGPVFVLGFPDNLSVGFGLPVWKSGFIASEPYYDVEVPTGGAGGRSIIPAFFVDALTRKGMSGAPVFAGYTGTWDMTDPYRPVDFDGPGFWSRDDIAMGHSAMEFVGIYSGRAPGEVGGGTLGICWRGEVVQAVCEGGKVGGHPHL